MGRPVENGKVHDVSSAVAENAANASPNGRESANPVKVENKWKDPHRKIVSIIQGSEGL